MKKLTKKYMAEKLGLEYLGKGFDDSCEDGFIVREYGTTNHRSIGTNQEQAYEWLLERFQLIEEDEETEIEYLEF